AAGLALASSLSGVFLLYKNIKEFGFNNFLAIIKFRKFVPILAICVVEIVILYFFKGFINGYF
ncbi:MAG: lipid II flippase MurJ, partial [Campylobacter sp.]|nr:lipid II flippase MurJ [Campylobacter sp.]